MSLEATKKVVEILCGDGVVAVQINIEGYRLAGKHPDGSIQALSFKRDEPMEGIDVVTPEEWVENFHDTEDVALNTIANHIKGLISKRERVNP